MKFSGKRLEFCVACERKLPEGSRIDRKHCSTACIERAYYQRHPDKAHVPGSRRRRIDQAEVGSNLLANEAASRGPRPEAACDQEPRKRTQPQAGTAMLQLASPSAAKTIAVDNELVVALEKARQQNAELTRQLEAAVAREVSTREELAKLRQRYQRTSQARGTASRVKRKGASFQAPGIGAATKRGKSDSKVHRAGKKLAILKNEETAAIVQDGAPGESAHFLQAPLVTVQTTHGLATAQVSGQRQPDKAPIQPQRSPPSTIEKTVAGTALDLAPRWEWHSKRAGGLLIIKKLDSPEDRHVRILNFSRGVQDKLLSQIRREKGRRSADTTSLYIGDLRTKDMLDILCVALVRRILCTDPAHRETAQQKTTLARSALTEVIEELTQGGYAKAAVLRQEIAAGPNHLLCVAGALVSLCQGTWLKSV